MNVKNIFKEIPSELPDELLECLVCEEHVKIERIVSKGHSSPQSGWYDQNTNEWVMVIKGQAQLSFEDRTSVCLGQGDFINIPAHVKHKVDWTDAETETIWLAVHYHSEKRH